MVATVWKITIEQGATWRTSLTLTERDLTGCTARMHIRERIESPSPVIALTSDEDDGITITPGPPGVITVVIPAETTTAIDWRYGVYDLELISPDGTVERLLKGDVLVDPEVTRD